MKKKYGRDRFPKTPIYLLIAFRLLGHAFGASPVELVEEGNKVFAEGGFNEALAIYEQANEHLPDNEIIRFNKGVALSQQGNY